MRTMILPSWQRTGLYAWYPFTGVEDEATLLDHSGNGYDLPSADSPTVHLLDRKNGVTPWVGDCLTAATAARWDGTSFPNNASHYTMFGWARSNALSGQQTIFVLGAGGNVCNLYFNNTTLYSWSSSGGNMGDSLTLTSDSWIFVAVTLGGTSYGKALFVYDSGANKFSYTANAAQTWVPTVDGFAIGVNESDASRLNGYVADIRIYDYAMKQEQLFAIATRGPIVNVFQDSAYSHARPTPIPGGIDGDVTVVSISM